MKTEYTDLELEVFEFLDDLRIESTTNMFGAVPYIVARFKVSIKEARGLLIKWMETFDERHKE